MMILPLEHPCRHAVYAPVLHVCKSIHVSMCNACNVVHVSMCNACNVVHVVRSSHIKRLRGRVPLRYGMYHGVKTNRIGVIHEFHHGDLPIQSVILDKQLGHMIPLHYIPPLPLLKPSPPPPSPVPSASSSPSPTSPNPSSCDSAAPPQPTTLAEWA